MWSFADFERQMGGLDAQCESSYQVQQYFTNGGSVAFCVRVAPKNAIAASRELRTSGGQSGRFQVVAVNPGAWGNALRVAVGTAPAASDGRAQFTLWSQQVDGAGGVVSSEVFAGLSFDLTSVRDGAMVVNSTSSLIRLVDSGVEDGLPALWPTTGADLPPPEAFEPLVMGTDGTWSQGEFAAAMTAAVTEGSSPLSLVGPEAFNLLCLPCTAQMSAADAAGVMAAGLAYCQTRRAFYLVDVPDTHTVTTVSEMLTWFETTLEGLPGDAGAVYYPRLLLPDALNGGKPRETGASGTLAGLYAATDAAVGVWKAPAGTARALMGVVPAVVLNDDDDSRLTALGINAIRSFAAYGVLSWGARTLKGADALASQWKYVPVRRMAQFVESSVAAGLTWAVFEPNAEALWSAMRLEVTAFLSSLFERGAFQGAAPMYGYFVRCDGTTTTQDDIDRGVVNLLVGFAPMKPAEFVVLQVQQQVCGATS